MNEMRSSFEHFGKYNIVNSLHHDERLYIENFFNYSIIQEKKCTTCGFKW